MTPQQVSDKIAATALGDSDTFSIGRPRHALHHRS